MAAKKTTAEAKSALLDAYTLIFEEARAEFEAEKAEQAAAWKKELARLKEEDLYAFNKDKRDREDSLVEELKSRKAEVAAAEEELRVREEAIEAKEEHIDFLEVQAQQYPSEVKTAEYYGYGKGKADAVKEAEMNLKLKEAEWNADKRVLMAKTASQADMIANYESTLNSLHSELQAANSRVESIATSAVNAAGQSKVNVHTGTTSK